MEYISVSPLMLMLEGALHNESFLIPNHCAESVLIRKFLTRVVTIGGSAVFLAPSVQRF